MLVTRILYLTFEFFISRLKIRTQKQSYKVKSFLCEIIKSVTMFASPIFAEGAKGNGGIRSSTENKASATAESTAERIR